MLTVLERNMQSNGQRRLIWMNAYTLYIYMSAHVWVSGRTRVDTCIWRPKGGGGDVCLSLLLSTICCGTRSPTKPGAQQLARFDGQQAWAKGLPVTSGSLQLWALWHSAFYEGGGIQINILTYTWQPLYQLRCVSIIQYFWCSSEFTYKNRRLKCRLMQNKWHIPAQN